MIIEINKFKLQYGQIKMYIYIYIKNIKNNEYIWKYLIGFEPIIFIKNAFVSFFCFNSLKRDAIYSY